jgi:nicotinate-nucleotide pyrophosphorylase (carboxylating)
VAIDPIPRGIVPALVAAALAEDHASDDATTLAVVDGHLIGQAVFVARQPGVAAGFALAAEAFRQIDPSVRFVQRVAEGERFESGATIATAEGPARCLLQAERVALNFVQRLCATATLTRAFVDAVAGTSAVILDTRKTTPGLREVEKYAVRCGGGINHRSDLAAMAMIKDNHREALAREGKTLADGVAAIRARTPGIRVEVEIDSLDELEAALAARPEWILLDNMRVDDMRAAVLRTASQVKLEASGGVNLESVREIAATGVDYVSVGALTHSAKSLDISLELTFAG